MTPRMRAASDAAVITRDLPACLEKFTELARLIDDEPAKIKLRECYKEARDNPNAEIKLVALTIASYVLTAYGQPCALRMYRTGNSEGQTPCVRFE